MSVAYAASGIGTHSEGRHFHLLERVISTALSPLDYDSATEWGDALTAAICHLADVRAGAILLPAPTPRWRAITLAGADRHAAAWGLHEEATERLHDGAADNLVFWVGDDLASESHRSVGSPAGTLGIRVRTTSGDVAAIVVHPDRSAGVASYQLVAALRAIAPALRSGVTSWVASAIARSNVARMLDSLADPALLFDAGGQLVHANQAVARLTGSVDVSRLRDEAQRIAWALSASARRRSSKAPGARSAPETSDTSVRTVRIATTIYQLRGSIVGEQLLGNEPGVFVTMTTTTAEPLSDDALHAAYSLTPREIEVVRLIAEGLSNQEIGERLGIRFFTARNHVERALAKLGVTSRHRVGPLLRNEAAEGEPGRASAA